MFTLSWTILGSRFLITCSICWAQLLTCELGCPKGYHKDVTLRLDPGEQGEDLRRYGGHETVL